MPQDGVTASDGTPTPAKPSESGQPAPSNPPAQDSPEQSNFKKVQESRDEWRRKAEEAEGEAKRLRDERQADEDRKLKEKEDYKTLAEQKEAEAKAAREEANALQVKVKAFEDQQEAELSELLKEFPEGKAPPLDTTDPVSKRLSQAKYARSLIASQKPDNIGGGVPKGATEKQARITELLKKPRRTEKESNELAQLSGETA